MARGRRSEASEFTLKIEERLVDLKVKGYIDDYERVGNTIKIWFDKDTAFKCVPNPLTGGTGVREAKYSVTDCINAVADYLRQKMNPSSTKFTFWSKQTSTEENPLPSAQQVISICDDVWPARAIMMSFMQGTFSDKTPEEIIALQKELDAEDELESAAIKAEAERKKSEREARKLAEQTA